MKRMMLCALALVAASTGVVGAQAPAAPVQAKPTVLQKVLVKVNGAIFTKTELEQLQIDALREQNKRQLSQMDLQNDEKLREELVRITPELLANAIDELIIVQRGRELGLRLSDIQFKEYVDNIKKENQLDETTFQTALEQQGLTMAQLRKNIEKAYMIQGVQRTDVAPRIAITEEEARQMEEAERQGRARSKGEGGGMGGAEPGKGR